MPVATTETTTTARYRVVALATTLAMVTYLDRTAIGTLAPGIRRDLGLSAVEMGWIFTAFQLAYGLFEIPTGRWADRVGTRSVLARIVIWWSAMTMATAAAGSYVTMLVVRFLFGAGEAGAWPSVARTFSRWIPQQERGRVQGIFFCGAHLVAGITPAFIVGGGLLGPWPGLLTVMSWRGEEGGIVLSGRLEVTVDAERRILGPGDAYSFDSRRPHRFRCVGPNPCEVVSACTPPSF